MRLRDRLFLVLEALDERLSGRVGWLCRLVGRMEIGFYERTTDWDHPLYVNPKTAPEMYLRHAADLCAHGYRNDCPHGCHQ